MIFHSYVKLPEGIPGCKASDLPRLPNRLQCLWIPREILWKLRLTGVAADSHGGFASNQTWQWEIWEIPKYIEIPWNTPLIDIDSWFSPIRTSFYMGSSGLAKVWSWCPCETFHGSVWISLEWSLRGNYPQNPCGLVISYDLYIHYIYII